MNTMIEMYDRIMSVVEEVTGISIAELTGLTRPGVCIIRNNFKYRRKRYFVNLNYERVYAKVFDSKEKVKG
jgi:hypothetical protein